jgi:glycosyltransferase involved in cell wall biosynthesis
MATPLVSILIPCHNAAPWLAQTLESALAQTWPHQEIIVVDDGSRDDSAEIARTFADRGVKVIVQENHGASAARNRAYRLSQGDFIQYLDADDLLAPDKIEHQMSLADKTGPDAVLCGTWSRFTHTPADADFIPQPLCTDAVPIDWVVTKFEQNAMMHPAAWLTPRTLAERAGPWDENLSLDDDGEYFTRVVLASRGIRFCREAVSYYRSNLAGSLSGTKSERAWASAFRSLVLSSGRLLALEDTPRTRHACATIFQSFIYESYPRAAECRDRAAAKVAALGGSTLPPPGGPKYRWARRLLGWRLAKRLQQWR